MKKFYLSLITVVALTANAQTSLPYLSDMTSWEKVNAGRGNNWVDWNSSSDSIFPKMTDEEKALSGCDEGIICKYDGDFDSDAWAISPAISLDEGTQYKVSVFVRDAGEDNSSGYGSEEQWKLAVAEGATVDALEGGETLIDKKRFNNNQTLIEYSVIFTPEKTADYHFGLNCYSEADNYAICATGFGISSVSAVTAIESDSNAQAEYFNILGVKVAQPKKGNIYIVRQGSKTFKSVY